MDDLFVAQKPVTSAGVERDKWAMDRSTDYDFSNEHVKLTADQLLRKLSRYDRMFSYFSSACSLESRQRDLPMHKHICFTD